MIGLSLGLSLGVRSGGTPAPAPSPTLTYAMLPAGTVLFDSDWRFGVTAPGDVISAITDQATGVTLTQATAAQQPTLIPNHPAAGGPAASFDGLAANGDELDGGQIPVDTDFWGYHFWERLEQNNTSGSNTRAAFVFGRSSDSKRISLVMLRPTTDPTQAVVNHNAAGGTSVGANISFTADGDMHVINHQVRSANGDSRVSIDNGDWGPERSTGGSTTFTGTSLGGEASAAVNKAAMITARDMFWDFTKLKGGYRQRFNLFMLNAIDLWQRGREDKMGDQPFSTRAPTEDDIPAVAYGVQIHGNSLANNRASSFQTLLGYRQTGTASPNGIICDNGGDGGSTSVTIAYHVYNGENLGPSGATAGLSAAEKTDRVLLLVDVRQNDSGASIATGSIDDAVIMALTAGSATVTVASVTGTALADGQKIMAPGIPNGTILKLGTSTGGAGTITLRNAGDTADVLATATFAAAQGGVTTHGNLNGIVAFWEAAQGKTIAEGATIMVHAFHEGNGRSLDQNLATRALNAALAAKFGDNFIYERPLLAALGAPGAKYDYTLTADPVVAQQAYDLGLPPPIVWGTDPDTVHYSATGEDEVALIDAEALHAKGYLPPIIAEVLGF